MGSTNSKNKKKTDNPAPNSDESGKDENTEKKEDATADQAEKNADKKKKPKKKKNDSNAKKEEKQIKDENPENKEVQKESVEKPKETEDVKETKEEKKDSVEPIKEKDSVTELQSKEEKPKEVVQETPKEEKPKEVVQETPKEEKTESLEKPKEEQAHKEESNDQPKEQKKLSRLEKDELFFHHLGDHWKTLMHKELDLHGFRESLEKQEILKDILNAKDDTEEEAQKKLEQDKDLYVYASLSAVAYSGTEKIMHQRLQDYLPDRKITIIKAELSDKWSRHQPAYIIGTLDDTVFLSVRGTKGISDWIVDSRIQPETDPILDCKVHGGIAKATLKFWTLIQAELMQLAVSNKRIVFCGHSLGAATAAIMSIYTFHTLRLQNEHTNWDIRCYCYAPPPCIAKSKGKLDFITSIVYAYDVVPRLSHESLHKLAAKREYFGGNTSALVKDIQENLEKMDDTLPDDFLLPPGKRIIHILPDGKGVLMRKRRYFTTIIPMFPAMLKNHHVENYVDICGKYQ